VPEESMEEQWDLPALEAVLAAEWQLHVPMTELLAADPNLTDEDLLGRLLTAADVVYQSKVDVVGKDAFSGFERNVMLQSMDTQWREHLAALDHLRHSLAWLCAEKPEAGIQARSVPAVWPNA
jgi:preprotein translocase subunit SecA